MDRIKLKLLGLSYSISQNGSYLLVLSDETDTKRVPIIIGVSEAQSVAVMLENIHTKRPMTHDLIKNLTDALKMELKEVFIYRLEEGIFYSELLFENGEQIIKLDSRTSDAIALAIRYDSPIYTTSEIMRRASVDNNQKQGNSDIVNQKIQKEDNREFSSYSMSELNDMLQEAIKNEEYEKASDIRDILKKKTTLK